MSEFSLSQVIQTLPQSTLHLQRPSFTAITQGRREPIGETLNLSFAAHVQPTKPSEIKRIAGGESIESAITIWTETELQTANGVDGQEADLVDYRGRRYKIISAADWSGQGFRTFIGGEVAIGVAA